MTFSSDSDRNAGFLTLKLRLLLAPFFRECILHIAVHLRGCAKSCAALPKCISKWLVGACTAPHFCASDFLTLASGSALGRSVSTAKKVVRGGRQPLKGSTFLKGKSWQIPSPQPKAYSQAICPCCIGLVHGLSPPKQASSTMFHVFQWLLYHCAEGPLPPSSNVIERDSLPKVYSRIVGWCWYL